MKSLDRGGHNALYSYLYYTHRTNSRPWTEIGRPPGARDVLVCNVFCHHHSSSVKRRDSKGGGRGSGARPLNKFHCLRTAYQIRETRERLIIPEIVPSLIHCKPRRAAANFNLCRKFTFSEARRRNNGSARLAGRALLNGAYFPWTGFFQWTYSSSQTARTGQKDARRAA